MRGRTPIFLGAWVALAAALSAAEPVAPAASSSAPGNPAARKAAIDAGPATNWTFPIFSDREGYRVLTCRGSSVVVKSANEIEVTDFSAIVFSGDAKEQVESVLLSPEATFFPDDQRATGTSTVRVVHDDAELVGRDWVYQHGKDVRTLSISRDTRVTFKAQLNAILK